MSPIEIGKSSGPSQHGWHKISSYLRCPHEYLQEQVRGIRAPMEYTPDPLAQGLMVHAMRARWFANAFDTSEKSWNSILDAARNAANEAPAPFLKSSEEAALNLFQAYMKFYADKELPKPVACEYLVEGQLDKGDGPSMLFSARLDDVSRYAESGGALAVGEAKTSSDISNTVREYELHGQPMLQAALWEIAPQGAAIHGSIQGVVLDILRKPQGTPGKKGYWAPKFVRMYMPFKKEVLEWHVRELRRAKSEALMLMWDSKARRNITACTRMIGRARVDCPYKQLCLHGKDVASQYLLRNGNYMHTWQPTEEQQVAPWE